MRRLSVHFKPSFLRQFKKLESALQDEAREKIKLLQTPQYHTQLRVHALKGPLVGYKSFSVNYRYRIIFKYIDTKNIVLLAIGDHDVYK